MPIYQEQKIIINNKNYIYYIWETPGAQLRIVSKYKKIIKDSKIVLIIFSKINKSSFEKVDYWYNYIKQILGKDQYIIALVGNKNDLFEDMEITEEEMEKKAGELNIKLKMIVPLMMLKDLKDF